MKNFFKGKIATAIILLATFVLAGVAIFTAIRLYQLRQTPVAPNVPSSKPRAVEPSANCSLSFTLTASTPSATPSATPTASPSATPTATPTATPATPTPTTAPTAAPNACGGTCGSNLNCGSSLICYSGYCRNPSCTSDTDCVCSTAAPTTTTTIKTAASSTPTPTQPALPQSGTDWPTFLGIGIGILTIVGSLLLAL